MVGFNGILDIGEEEDVMMTKGKLYKGKVLLVELKANKLNWEKILAVFIVIIQFRIGSLALGLWISWSWYDIN